MVYLSDTSVFSFHAQNLSLSDIAKGKKHSYTHIELTGKNRSNFSGKYVLMDKAGQVDEEGWLRVVEEAMAA